MTKWWRMEWSGVDFENCLLSHSPQATGITDNQRDCSMADHLKKRF